MGLLYEQRESLKGIFLGSFLFLLVLQITCILLPLVKITFSLYTQMYSCLLCSTFTVAAVAVVPFVASRRWGWGWDGMGFGL